MRRELAAAGHEVHVVAVNAASAATAQDALTAVCDFPLLQDTDAAGAWALLGGAKDDLFVLDAEGGVVTHLPYGGAVETNLSTDTGYANVKAALLAVE